MLNYETLLCFVYFLIILCGKIYDFVEKVLSIVEFEVFYCATYQDKSKG